MRRGRGIVTPWSLRRAVARAARSHAAGGGRRAAPAVEGDALAQADEPPAVAARPVVAAPVVADHELDGLRLVVDAHDRARGGRVAHDVDERLLDDAKGGGVDAGRQVEGVAAHVELDRQPGRAHALHERPDPLQRGLRRQRELLVAAPQDAEQAAQLPERLSAGLLDRGDGGAGARGVGRHGALGGRGLDEHDRHVVGDDVVQLARDPGALAQDRRRLARGAVALDLARLLVQASVERVARAQHAAGERRDADRHDRHPGDAARHVAGHALEHRGRREHATAATPPITRSRVGARRPTRKMPTTHRKTATSEELSRRPPMAAWITKSRSTASRLARGARHAKASGTGVRTAKTSVTARTPACSGPTPR
jgi:hypothetical protein